MISVPRHTGELFDGTPGPWWQPMDTEAGATAYVKCPNGHIAGIGSHTIHDDGRVEPSVVCDGECDWHEFITLEGWPDRANALL